MSIASLPEQEKKAIWTHKEFNWAYRNPVATLFTRGNDYVTEQWSEEYFTAMKGGVGLMKDSLKNVYQSLKAHEFADAGKHLVNALIVISKLAINIELGNFIKGVIGTIISALKLGQHAIVGSLCLAGLILTPLFLILGKPELAKKLFFEMLNNFGFLAKDIVSIVSSIGHAIPSWLPLLVLFVCPPAGIGLAIVKAASDFTGIFDVMAYGGTAILLYSKAKFAKWDLAKDGSNEEAKKAVEAWNNLKKELNPFKSLEGATLAMYGLHVLVEGAQTVLNIFVPGAGTLITYGAYGLQAAVGVALGATVYSNTRSDEKGGKTTHVADSIFRKRVNIDADLAQLRQERVSLKSA